MTTATTTVREYRNDWIGEHYPLETRYGRVTIQPLGWGMRVESRRETVYEHGERIHVEDPPLSINGRSCRCGRLDYPVDLHGNVGEPGAMIGGDVTANAEAKLRAELRPLVLAWYAEHEAEFARTAEAYRSNRARTCEESIAELEAAVVEYRRRLELLEAGDAEVSPYLNGGRRLEL
jgi:hypothetical protein